VQEQHHRSKQQRNATHQAQLQPPPHSTVVSTLVMNRMPGSMVSGLRLGGTGHSDPQPMLVASMEPSGSTSLSAKVTKANWDPRGRMNAHRRVNGRMGGWVNGFAQTQVGERSWCKKRAQVAGGCDDVHPRNRTRKID